MRLTPTWLLLPLSLLYLTLATLYNATNPLFEAPDEIWHYLYVRHLAEGRGLPVQAPRHSHLLAQQEAGQPPLYYATAALLTFWAPRADLAALVVENLHATIGHPSVPGNKNRFVHGPAERFPWTGEVLTVHLVRATSTLWGLLTVLLTYALARQIGVSPALALSASLTVALIPQFLYMTSAVNNDSAAAATGALLLWSALRTSQRPPTIRGALGLGAVLGLATLAKPSSLVGAVLVAAALGLAARHTARPWPTLLRSLVLAGLATLAVCGWWFGRNVLLYGELVPLRVFLGRARLDDEVPSLAQVLADLPGLFASFWALFGWFSVPAPPEDYVHFGLLSLLAVLGWLVHASRVVRRTLLGRSHRLSAAAGKRPAADPRSPAVDRLPPAAVALVALWALLVLGALLRYRLIVLAFQGRLLFAAVSAIALLLVLGWWGLSARRAALLPLALALSLLWPALRSPWTMLIPAYAPPPVRHDPTPNPPLQARFGPGIGLRQAVVAPTTLAPGEEITVALDWQALAPLDRPYSLSLQLLDWQNRPLTQVDTFPGYGAYATTLWQPGDRFTDRYRLRLPPETPVPAQARLVLVIYWRPSMARLPVLDAAGRPQGDHLPLARLRLRGPQDPTPRPGPVFGEAIRLLSAAVETPAVRPGEAVRGRLLYQCLAPLAGDYTVFVHLVGPAGLVAQDDSPPRRGAYPTSLWEPGDLVEHAFAFTLPADLSPGLYQLVTGWYDLATGQRLSTAAGDALAIGTVEVQPAATGPQAPARAPGPP